MPLTDRLVKKTEEVMDRVDVQNRKAEEQMVLDFRRTEMSVQTVFSGTEEKTENRR